MHNSAGIQEGAATIYFKLQLMNFVTLCKTSWVKGLVVD